MYVYLLILILIVWGVELYNKPYLSSKLVLRKIIREIYKKNSKEIRDSNDSIKSLLRMI